MVTIPVFMMLRIAIKALGKLRFNIPLAIILDSKNRHFQHILISILTSELPIA